MDDPQRAREQFEAWANAEGYCVSRLIGHNYLDVAVQAAWDAWQAALRAAPEVPAARVTEPLRADEPRQEQADAAIYNRGWNDCRTATLAARPQGLED